MMYCAFCGAEFTPGKTNNACCSVTCANRRRRARPLTKPCERCGASFEPKKIHARFCGPTCSALSRVPGTEQERFWAKVEKSDGCWNWIGALNADGYGLVRFNGETRGAHRVAWSFAHGAMPTLQVLHKCDNPRCVRIEHLFLGTHADNMLDMAVKGRSWHRKLNVKQVREARARCAAGETHRAVATDLGISRESVRDIVSGKKWKWVH